MITYDDHNTCYDHMHVVFQNGFNFGFDWTPVIKKIWDFVFKTTNLGVGDLVLS